MKLKFTLWLSIFAYVFGMDHKQESFYKCKSDDLTLRVDNPYCLDDVNEKDYNHFHVMYLAKKIDYSMTEKICFLQKKVHYTESALLFDRVPNEIKNIIVSYYIALSRTSAETQLWQLIYPKIQLHKNALSLPEYYVSAWQRVCARENDDEWNKKIMNIVCLWPYTIKKNISEKIIDDNKDN